MRPCFNSLALPLQHQSSHGQGPCSNQTVCLKTGHQLDLASRLDYPDISEYCQPVWEFTHAFVLWPRGGRRTHRVNDWELMRGEPQGDASPECRLCPHRALCTQKLARTGRDMVEIRPPGSHTATSKEPSRGWEQHTHTVRGDDITTKQ